MDEATSALDYNTERQLCLNLQEWASGRTVLFITHRHFLPESWVPKVRRRAQLHLNPKGAWRGSCSLHQGREGETGEQRGLGADVVAVLGEVDQLSLLDLQQVQLQHLQTFSTSWVTCTKVEVRALVSP